MIKKNVTVEDAAQVLIKQAKLVALDVARAEVITDHAFGAAVLAMVATAKTSDPRLIESAKEILNVARLAAAKALIVAKTEAEKTLAIAKNLASERLLEE